MKKQQFISMVKMVTIAICLQGSANADYTNRLPAPSLDPGKAQAYIRNDVLSLKNNVLVMAWDMTDGHLRPREIRSLVQNQSWAQDQCDLFRMALGERIIKPRDEEGDLYIGMRIEDTKIKIMISDDGKSWQNFYQHAVKDRKNISGKIRLGKMDITAGNKDHSESGEEGICRLDEFYIDNRKGTELVAEHFDHSLA